MTTPAWFGPVFCAACLAFIGALFVWAVRLRARRMRAMQRLALACGGRATGEQLTGTHAGITYRGVCAMPVSEGENPLLHLKVPCTMPGWFAVYQHTWMTGAVQWLKLARTMRTGDMVFDRVFDVITPPGDTSLTAGFFADAARRDAVRRLFTLGAAQLELHDGELDAQWSIRHLHMEDVQPALIQQAVGCLGALAKDAPSAGVRTGDVGMRGVT